MRMWHRFQILMLLLTATTTTFSTVRAQEMMGSPYGAPAFMGGPGSYPGASVQGMPPGFLPHSNIAPFENAFEQHYESDGLWFKRVIGGMSPLNDYYFNVDYVITNSRAMSGLVGDSNAPTFIQDAVTSTTDTDRDGAVTFPETNFLPMFAPYNTRIIGNIENMGVRLSGGVNNQTGWRFAWDVTYGGDSNDVYDARQTREAQQIRSVDALYLAATGGVTNGINSNGLPTNLRNVNERQVIETQILNARVFDAADAEDFGVLGSTAEILDRQLYPYGGISLQNGVEIDGVVQMFDLDYIVKHGLETNGAGFHFASSPMYESGSLQIRPLVGGRYFRIQEGFYFGGVDSGLDYQANQPDGIDDDNDFIIDNVAENGTNTFTDPITDDTREILIRSFVNSQVRSTMAGPEIGVEYEVAKKKGVRFTGSTRVGAMINSERMSLSGDNIGDVFATETDLDTGLIVNSQMFDTSTAGGVRTQNFFTDAINTTHVSPLFEQQLNADIPVFSKIPVLRDIWQLESAKLRLGWKYTWIGEVANPTQSIVWASNPRAGLFPSLKTERGNFWQNQFNIGINWEF